LSTHTHIYVGPGARRPWTPGGQQIYTDLCGAGGPVRQGFREVIKCTQLSGARGPCMPGTPGKSTNIRSHVGPGVRPPGGQHLYTFMWGPGVRTPATPGGQQIYIFMWGPYARDFGRSTNMDIYVGPGARTLGPRELNKYTPLGGARCPYARDPGGSTHIHSDMGPGGP
jgi:hypothetical protein